MNMGFEHPSFMVCNVIYLPFDIQIQHLMALTSDILLLLLRHGQVTFPTSQLLKNEGYLYRPTGVLLENYLYVKT